MEIKQGGVVSQLLAGVPIPRMFRARQIFPQEHIEPADIPVAVMEQLDREPFRSKVKPGMEIAITAGSRGIANVDIITKAVVDFVKSRGATPFIVPAMGSHGGATAEGQLEILAGYGITPETMGCEIRSSMKVVELGVSDTGMPVYMDKNAYHADGIIISCRLKPHNAFRGPYESGPCKMMTVGLGKQKGAERVHAEGMGKIGKNIPSMAKVALEKAPILFAIPCLENAYDQTWKLEAIDKDDILAREPELLKEAKRIEFPDNVIAKLTGKTEAEIHDMRYENGIVAAYKMVDTCAAEFEAATPYYYSVFGSENEAEETHPQKKVLVLGSGPIRIGQGIEFDYCSVHSTWAFSKEGWETVIVNNNPETVSTDFDIADKLYFEPLTPEDVEAIVKIEKPDGAVVQFGGQTAIKLTESLMKMGVKILGTKAEDVDAAEDRELFDEILEKTQIPRAAGGTVFTAEEAKEVANRLGYPVLVRPSYVLGGQGMKIAFNDEEIEEFIGIINRIAQDHPILVDKYLQGKEIEVDAVCDGTDILIPGIMEHIERTGIHSGDSISVYPAPTISEPVKEMIVEYTKRLAQALHVIGLINIQFIVMDEQVYVIEVNPRSSRTVPYISKVTGIPIVDLATKVIIGETIRGMGYEPGLAPTADYIAIKMPVFSFEKLRGAEISLGPEMKSTGECLGIAKTFNEALYKAFLGAGVKLPKYKQMIMTVKDADKPEAVGVAKRFEALGYKIYATRSTAKYLQEHGVNALRINKISQESPNVMDLILGHKIDLVIDTPTQGNGDKNRDGFLIRRNAIETGVYCITAMDTANALAQSLETATNELTPIDIATVKNL